MSDLEAMETEEKTREPITFDGYTIEEVVQGSLHTLPGIAYGSERYNALVKSMEQYLEVSQDVMNDCPTVFPNLTELLAAALILYHMVCNEVYCDPDDVTEEEKEVATNLLYTALQQFDVCI